MKKRMIYIIIAAIILFIGIENDITYANINGADITLPSEEEAIISGFAEKRTIKVFYDIGKTLDGQTVSSNQIVGYAHLYAGKYRATEKYNGQYYSGMLLKVVMEPCVFQSTSGRKFYGYSEKLILESDLTDYVEYQENSPKNSTSGSTSYTIGISGGYQEAAVSGSVTLKHEHCQIIDYSSVSDTYFNVVFDYKPSAIDFFTNSERNIMLFNQTWQYATCGWTSSVASLSEGLKTKVEFGISQSQSANGFSNLNQVVDSQSFTTLRYSSSMQ